MIGEVRFSNVALLIALIVLSICLPFFLKPTDRPKDLSDPNLNFPFQSWDRVPAWELIMGSYGLPTVIYFAAERITGLTGPGILSVLFASVETNVLTGILTDIFKNLAGRPRPYYATLCKSFSNSSTPSDDCTPPDLVNKLILSDAQKSFPSGHASLSFAAATLIVCVLVSMWRSSATYQKNTLVTIVTILPLCLSTYVAVSRVMDYRHHFADIVGGAALGTMVSALVFNVHFADPIPTPQPAGGRSSNEYGSV